MTGTRIAAWLAGVAGLALMAGSAHAQSPSSDRSNTIEEIIVTASKTGSQSLQKTPLAIQAFTADLLKEKNISRVDDLIQAIPGASENTQSGVVNRSFNLRGVGASGTNGDSPIGYYLDDVPFNIPNFGIAPPINFVDLERVEILRGPQGTLYGQGAAGGIFIFHTKDPDLENFKFSGESSLSQTKDSSRPNYGASAVVSIPIVQDKLAVRISGSYSRQQGFAELYDGSVAGALLKKDVNFVKNKDVRMVVLWRPTDNLQLRGQVWHFRPQQGYSNLLQNIDPPAFYAAATGDGYSDGKFTLYSLAGELALKGVTLNSSTSYIDGQFASLFPTPPAGSFLSAFQPKSFAQEVRARSNGSGPLHWVVGGQYQDAEGPQHNVLDLKFVPLFLDTSNNTVTKNWAAFGEVSYDLFDGKLIPLVGVRYYEDKRTYKEAPVSIPTKTNKTTWRVNLAYIPTDNLTAFATISTGFRAGVIQSAGQALLLQLDGIPAQTLNAPDTLTNYEAGVKFRTADGALSLGANLYRINFKNLQSSVTSTAGVGGFANIGDAHTTGLDLEAQWRTPLEGFTLGAVANINDTKFDEVLPQVQARLPTARPGARLFNASEYNYRLDANYTGRLTDTLDGFANVALSRFGNRVMSSGDVAAAYSLLTATMGIRSGPWEMALVGDNLADERGPTFILGQTIRATIRPRTIGIRIRADY